LTQKSVLLKSVLLKQFLKPKLKRVLFGSLWSLEEPLVSETARGPETTLQPTVENRMPRELKTNQMVGYKKLVAIAKEGVWENKNLFYPHRL
jgi:hypothetical protein